MVFNGYFRRLCSFHTNPQIQLWTCETSIVFSFSDIFVVQIKGLIADTETLKKLNVFKLIYFNIRLDKTSALTFRLKFVC